MSGLQFSRGEGERAALPSRSGTGDKRKRDYTESTSTVQDLEARRDAFRKQSKLLVSLDEAESRVYQAAFSSNMVTLLEKNKDDVFANHNLHNPSAIDVVSDDVNWYSINKERPAHAPGYVAKVVATDPYAVAALSATIIKLAEENNSNVVLAWFEFPGKAAGASPSKSELDNNRGVSEPKNPRLSVDSEASRPKNPRLSVDSEASRPKKPRLSHDRNESLPPPVKMSSRPHADPDTICANCQYPGHILAWCPKPSSKGNIGGCPIHNTKLHNLDNCYMYAGRDLSSLQNAQVISLCHLQVFGRSRRPAIRSERFFWLDCLLEAFKRNLRIKESNWSAASALPWTHEYTREVYKAALEPNDPQLGGSPTSSEPCSTKTPVDHNLKAYRPSDPFWEKKSVSDVAFAHGQGKLEHLRWAFQIPKSTAATAGTLGSRVPHKEGRPATPARKGPGLNENDEQRIKIDLRKELKANGLLNERGTILLPEEFWAMAPVDSPDRHAGLDAANRNNGGVKKLAFDTVRRVVARYRRCEMNEHSWDRHCPVERLLFDMVAEARSSQEARTQSCDFSD